MIIHHSTYNTLQYDLKMYFVLVEFFNDTFLDRLADKLGTEYFSLGLNLNINRQRIKRLEHDHVRDVLRVNSEMLSMWRDETVKSESKMVDELCNALSTIHLNNVVDFVRKGEFTVMILMSVL